MCAKTPQMRTCKNRALTALVSDYIVHYIVVIMIVSYCYHCVDIFAYRMYIYIYTLYTIFFLLLVLL